MSEIQKIKMIMIFEKSEMRDFCRIEDTLCYVHVSDCSYITVIVTNPKKNSCTTVTKHRSGNHESLTYLMSI